MLSGCPPRVVGFRGTQGNLQHANYRHAVVGKGLLFSLGSLLAWSGLGEGDLGLYVEQHGVIFEILSNFR